MNLDKLKKKLEYSGKPKKQSIVVDKLEDLTPLNGFKPTPKQLEAFLLKVMFILFGGAMGGGKSAALVNFAIHHCLKFAGARIFLCRQHLASFKKTTLLELEKWLPLDYVKRHNRTACFIEFRNGSRIYYGGLGDDIRAIEKLKSMELSAWGCDQVEEISEQFFHMLNSRLRLNIPNIQYKAWLTCNPTSNWVRQRFIENALQDHAFVPSLVKDNPYIPSDYEERLRESLPEELVEAWINGNWDIIADENQLFKYDDITQAMTRKASKDGEPIYAVDVARYGQDESVVSKRQGDTITFEKIFSKKSTMETAGITIKQTGFDLSAQIKVDSIGVGAGVVDRLKEQHYNVQEIVGSAKAKEDKTYKNKRAENFFTFRKLLPQLSIPNDKKLKAQMMAIRYRVLSDGLLIIESKDEIRKRGLPSPDRLDAVVMVCAESGYLSKHQVQEKLKTMRPQAGHSKWPRNREKDKRKALEEEMRQWMGGNKTVKGSKSQTYYPEDLGMESDIKPSENNREE